MDAQVVFVARDIAEVVEGVFDFPVVAVVGGSVKGKISSIISMS